MSPALRSAALAALALLTAATLLDHHGGETPRPRGTYDAIVVAGCRVDPGGVASPCLAQRTRRAVELWEAGLAPRIVLTGGVGAHPPAESVVAAALARAAGVPSTALVTEERSASTEGNAANTAERLGPDAVVLVVTDRYHVFRARRVLARHLAWADAVGVTPAPWPRVRGALREVAAVASYALSGRLADPDPGAFARAR